jgi:hypothetical protein
MTANMAAPFSHVSRCLDLSESDFEKGIDTREMCQKLLTQIAKVARAESGAPKLLLLFARMAQKGCDWLDGSLRIDLVGDEQVTVVEVLEDAGGVRERIFPPLALQVPLAEFTRAVQRVPHMIEPLEVVAASKRRMSLVGSLEDRMEASSPQISAASMFGATEPSSVPPAPPGGKLTFSLKSLGGAEPLPDDIHDRATALPEDQRVTRPPPPNHQPPEEAFADRPTRPGSVDDQVAALLEEGGFDEDEPVTPERITREPSTRPVLPTQDAPSLLDAPDDWDALLAEDEPPKK